MQYKFQKYVKVSYKKFFSGKTVDNYDESLYTINNFKRKTHFLQENRFYERARSFRLQGKRKKERYRENKS